MSNLLSLTSWREIKEETSLHSDKAYKQWKEESYPDKKEEEDNPISEIYDAYVTRLADRLDKHHDLYESYVGGNTSSEKFFQDVKAIKLLCEDFCAYMDRFTKMAEKAKDKK